MMLLRWRLLRLMACWLSLATVSASAQELHYTFTPACAEAYQAIVDLRLAEGRDQLKALRRSDPGNLIPVWLDDYADFFEVYISEDEAVFERLEARYQRRLNRLADGPKDSPYHLYTQANVMLHWALARLKFGEYVTTFREARRAYKLLEQNLERFPAFALTRKELGVLQAAVATVPDGYQWGVEFVTGMDGDLASGKALIESLLQELEHKNSPFVQETTAIYAFLLLNLEREEDAAWSRIQDAGFDAEESLLGTFVLANIAMRTGRNDEAIRLLSQKPHSPRYYPFPYLDFMMGVCLQRKLDGKAKIYLRSFIDRKRTGNFIKEAYQKLAWDAVLNKQTEDYFDFLGDIETFGTAVVGSDKNALREAELRTIPHPALLEARLLFDGGYYVRAAQALDRVDAALLHGEQAIELPYRAARVAAARGLNADAERLYKQTIAVGQDQPAYYACKSAVELGVLAERAGETAGAEAYFRLALRMKPSEYAAGLHQQAKAGLARVKG